MPRIYITCHYTGDWYLTLRKLTSFSVYVQTRISITKVGVTQLTICCHITPLFRPMVWNKTKEGCQPLAEPVLCQPLKIMLLRAVTLFKDLISNNACKLLSGNLTPSVWTQRQEKPSLFPPPLGAAAGGRDEGNCVKRDAEPQTWF